MALGLPGDLDMQNLYPASFPDHVPTIRLEKISLCKLLNGDEVEAERVFNICTSTGFFYLDMLDHAVGRQAWSSACSIRQLGQDRLHGTPKEEKLLYKPSGGVSVFDRGYIVRPSVQAGDPDEREFFNIPQSEFYGTKTEGGGLPPWLSQDSDRFKELLKSGNKIACAVMSVLEKQLRLPVGSFTKLHRLNDDSGDFVRVLRYAGAADGERDGPVGMPAHKDAMSVAILFTWLGGLQIPDPSAEVHDLEVKSEDWRWVRPEPGYAIVNLGDAMEIFTNQVLKSGAHRVVKAPGQQRPYDRYSVVVATRPENHCLMKALESPVIPVREQRGEIMTSLAWGHSLINGIRKREAEATARYTSGRG